MSFFEDLSSRKKKSAESVLLIDIGADSVAGAYARYEEGQLPTIVYCRQLPIEVREDETPESAMVRTLQLLGADLIREGAPALNRATGCGSADLILVSIETPWQETVARTEEFESEEPFLFTKSLVTKRLKQATVALPEQMLAEESVISTILNGYDTRTPYGKSAKRASVVILTSLIERRVAHDIISTLESMYHTKNIMPISGSSLRYQAMRSIFPHERDAIILDATIKSRTSITLVRNSIFVTMIQTTVPTDDATWVSTIANELAEIAKHYPLPRTIFLLTRVEDASLIQEELGEMNFSSLWLSDNPPKIVTVLQSHMTGMLRYLAAGQLDFGLLFMALYYQNRVPTEEGSV